MLMMYLLQYHQKYPLINREGSVMSTVMSLNVCYNKTCIEIVNHCQLVELFEYNVKHS